MATGYTQPVLDGEITEVDQFAWKCARAFGALSHMRESPNAPIVIPASYEPPADDYYSRELPKAEAELEEIQNMTLQEAAARSKAEVNVARQREEELNKNALAAAERYKALLEKVKAWDAPEELSHLKNYMVKELEEAIEHDARPFDLKVELLDGEAYIERKTQRLTDDIERMRERISERDRHGQESVRFLHALRDSVGPPR